MRAQIIQLLVMLTALHASTLIVDSFSTPAGAEATCDRAIDFMKGDVAQRIGGSVTYLELKSIENSPFNNANEEVIIGFGNRVASNSQRQVNYNILNSPGLLQEYSEKIITGCSNAIKVRYGMEGTGGGSGGWYLGAGNQVRREECVDFPGRNAPDLPWGKTYCW